MSRGAWTGPSISSAPPPAFFTNERGCFISAFTRPRRSILLSSLSYSCSLLLSLFEKHVFVSLRFQSPLPCCAHCQPSSRSRVVAAGPVLRKGLYSCSSAVLSHLGPVRQHGHQCPCATAGLLIFLLINANVAKLRGSESFSDSA